MRAVAAQRAAGAAGSLADLPASDRLANAVVTTVLYAAKLAVPTGLAAFYPHPGSRPAAAVVAAGGLLLADHGGRLATATPPAVPAGRLGVVPGHAGADQRRGPVGPQAMADRYAYVPSIGLFVAAVWAAADAVLAPGSAAAAAAAVAACGVVARPAGRVLAGHARRCSRGRRP